MLHCNDVSHWLGTSLESALRLGKVHLLYLHNNKYMIYSIWQNMHTFLFALIILLLSDISVINNSCEYVCKMAIYIIWQGPSAQFVVHWVMLMGKYIFSSYQSYCRRCSNYIFILILTPGLNGLGKDNYKRRQESFNFSDLVPSYIRDFTVL